MDIKRFVLLLSFLCSVDMSTARAQVDLNGDGTDELMLIRNSSAGLIEWFGQDIATGKVIDLGLYGRVGELTRYGYWRSPEIPSRVRVLRDSIGQFSIEEENSAIAVSLGGSRARSSIFIKFDFDSNSLNDSVLVDAARSKWSWKFTLNPFNDQLRVKKRILFGSTRSSTPFVLYDRKNTPKIAVAQRRKSALMIRFRSFDRRRIRRKRIKNISSIDTLSLAPIKHRSGKGRLVVRAGNVVKLIPIAGKKSTAEKKLLLEPTDTLLSLKTARNKNELSLVVVKRSGLITLPDGITTLTEVSDASPPSAGKSDDNAYAELVPDIATPIKTIKVTPQATPTSVPTVTLTARPTLLVSTPTPTFTPTLTPTPTFTFTATFTSSSTPTPTFTLTPTRTATPTYTSTPTFTHTPTFTSTETPTITPTPDVTAPLVTVQSLITSEVRPSLLGNIDDVTATIKVKVGTALMNATNNGDGTWSLPSSAYSADLGNGVYDVQVFADDGNGNVGYDLTTSELTVDTIPLLASSNPSHLETGVGITRDITLTFNENIIVGSGSIVISDGGSDIHTIPVTGSRVTVSGATMTINLPIALNISTTYSIIIPDTAIDDEGGNSYPGITSAGDYQFTTAATVIAYADSNDPGGNAYGVSGTGSHAVVANGGRHTELFSFDSAGMLTSRGNMVTVSQDYDVFANDNFVFAAKRGGGFSSFTIDSSSNILVPVDNEASGSPEARSVWSDGIFVYGADEHDGLKVYGVDGTGNLILKGNEYPGGKGYGVWGDGTFVYLASESQGLDVYTVGYNGLITHKSHDDQGGLALNVWGDGDYIYLANWDRGLEVYSVDGSGVLTHESNWPVGNNSISVIGDGKLLYVADVARGIDVFKTDGSGGVIHLQNLNTYSSGRDVWVKDDLVFLAADTSGLVVFKKIP